MCSKNDVDNDGVMLIGEIDYLNLSVKWCRKCNEKTEAQVVLRKKDAYCKCCFLSCVTHKFRACLGKSRTMRPGDKVLIGFSGNSNSLALLHLIKSGLQDSSHKKLMFDPFIIYIDEGAAVNSTHKERCTVIENINQALQTYDYPVYMLPLELATKSEEAIDKFLTKESYSVDDSTLQELFSSITDLTAKTDLLSKLRYNMLVQAARSLGCNKVFTAESADDLAVKLLINVSLGRGAQLPYDVGFSDDRFPDVKFIRPLRDLSKKELVYYNVFCGLSKPVHVPSLSTKVDSNSSIQKLTESFLCDLQSAFPSTLSTVFRVADKLTTNSANKDTCSLCKAPIDMDSAASSSLSATKFSSLVSSSGPLNFNALSLTEMNSAFLSDSSCNGSEETCHCIGSSSNGISKKELANILCYGCNLIMKDVDLNTLPVEIVKHLRESSQRFKMKKEINDFLL